MKRRLLIFGSGLLIGSMLSVLLFQYFGERDDEAREVEQLHVVLTTCDVSAGTVFERECVEVRTVAYQFVPPQALEEKELDWHVGKTFDVSLESGSVVRTVDFRDSE